MLILSTGGCCVQDGMGSVSLYRPCTCMAKLLRPSLKFTELLVSTYSSRMCQQLDRNHTPHKLSCGLLAVGQTYALPGLGRAA